MASRSLNRVILIGNLTRDPELKYTPAGTAVCTFGVATNRSWTTAEGQTKEETQYHRIVAWQKLAELSGKLLTKGRKIYLEGRLTYRSYVGKDGQQKSITEIVLDDFIVFSDGRKGGTEDVKIGHEEPTHEISYDVGEEDIPEPVVEESKNTRKSSEDVNPDDIPF
jgi:single-strand DNA-binding protein